MRTQIIVWLWAVCLALTGCKRTEQPEATQGKDIRAEVKPEVKVTNLMRTALEVWEGGEVIVSYVEIPPDTVLPKHYHPGEEFYYILEGSAVLWQKDKPDTLLKKGDVFKVPLKQVHTAITKKEGVKGLVFRVHEKGKPIRVNVE